MQTISDAASDVLIEKALLDDTSKDKKAASGLIKIKSRFGEIEVSSTNRIYFKHGMLGLPGDINFAITDLPGNNPDFKLLQCLEDNALSFIALPSHYGNEVVTNKDLDEACSTLSIDTENLLVLFIVTVHVKGEKTGISINAKAPVLIDVEKKSGAQYVFQNASYKIQQFIS